MYSFSPSPTNNKSRNIVICLFGGALALFLVISNLGDLSYRWVFQLTAIFLLTAAIFITTRYITKRFEYTFDTDECLFTVTELQRKSRMTVARISLDKIEAVCLIEENKKDQILKDLKASRRKQFDYRVDIKPAKSIVIASNEGGEPSLIYLSYDSQLFELLSLR